MNQNKLIKIGIWAYFFLLLFEGALRKWFLPGLSTPLLIIRDPLSIWVIFMVWRQGDFPKSAFVYVMVLIGVVGIFTALLFGHGNVVVAIYGARILLIHFPFMFAMGRILNRDDVLQLGRVLLWISIPMAVLMALQFFSPQTALVNRGVGGDTSGSGYEGGALGFFRPSATFSFTSGISNFFSVVAAFVIYFWLQPRVNRTVLIFSSIAVIAAIPLSISRGLFFSIVISIFFAVLAIGQNGRFLTKILGASLIIILGLALLSRTAFFQTAKDVLLARMKTASEAEGGWKGTFGDRYFGAMGTALLNSGQQPFWGYGIGIGTNVGSTLLSGQKNFLIAEEEWGRIIGELGALMGIAVIFIRIGLCVKLLVYSYKELMMGDLLPWMLLSVALLIMPQGQWAQPTALGFSTLIGGLLIASFNKSNPTTPKNNLSASEYTEQIRSVSIKSIST